MNKDINKKKTKRTLYECSRAKVHGRSIYCCQGIALSREKDGKLDVQPLEKGRSLIVAVCQTCSEFKRMGQPVAEEDRGWNKSNNAKQAPAAGKVI